MNYFISTRLVKCRFSLVATLLFLLVLRVPPAAAQNAITATPIRTAADSLLQAAREDTTYALQRLFHESRRRFAIQAVMRGAALSYFTYFTWHVLQTSDKAEQKVVNVLMMSASGYFFTKSAINLYRYRSGREKRVLTAFEQGHPIPTQIRNSFTKSYFDTPITSQ